MSSKNMLLVLVPLLIGFYIGYSYANFKVGEEVSILKEENSRLNLEIERLKNFTSPIYYEVYFSPNGGAGNRVIYWIDRANHTIYVAIYSFTHDEIGDAIVRAEKRGVDVKIVFETEQISKYSEYKKLKLAGVQVANDTNPSYMHNKFAIIDGYVVLTGSFNWSESADEKNNENLIVIISKDLAYRYTQEFF